MRTLFSFVFLPAFLLANVALAEPNVIITPLSLPPLPLGEATYEGGKTLSLNVGIGSAAFRDPEDLPGVIWTLTDRGPNLDCAGIDAIAGLPIEKLCAGDDKGKNFPLPAFNPTIYKLQIGADDNVKVLETIPLKGTSGKAISGLPNPFTSINTEKAYDVRGREIGADPSGLDTEGLVKLPDGTFWIGEEYASSIVEAAPDGTIKRRLVPAGIEGELSGADYPVEGKLPAIIANRYLNRGIENLAISMDGKVLYVMMQNPLANPDSDAYKASRNTRLWKLDRDSGQVVGQFLYVMDEATTFRADNKKEPKKTSDVRMSEVVAVGEDRLLVLERISKTTKFYLVNLSTGTSIGSSFDDPATSPSLEQLSADDLESKGIKPLVKTLLLDSDDIEGMPSKIEAVARISDRELVIINDSDFGIEGAGNRMLRMTFAEPLLK